MAEPWKTKITNIVPNKVQLRGYPIDELMGKISFAQTVYLAIKGELPSENIGKMIDAILVSSVDHGVTPPSAIATRTVASTGAPLNAALATGILSINKFHGGAIEDGMVAFKKVVAKSEEEKISISDAAEKIMKEFNANKERIKGFGHRVHTKDPRQVKLFSLAKELGIAGKFVEAAEAIAAHFVKAGKKLPINVDGAIGAVLCELDFPVELANAFFIMARIPGLTAHIYEEWTREKPMRKIDIKNWEYDGEDQREI